MCYAGIEALCTVSILNTTYWNDLIGKNAINCIPFYCVGYWLTCRKLKFSVNNLSIAFSINNTNNTNIALWLSIAHFDSLTVDSLNVYPLIFKRFNIMLAIKPNKCVILQYRWEFHYCDNVMLFVFVKNREC